MIPRITVVVPTRERFETLHWAIKTCVTQDYDNLEILISDNASEDSTREVIEAYDDSRIRYLNPGRRLGMSEHWEFALSHVTSGFVAVIGDDDGLMPEAVREIAPLLVEDVPLVWPIQQYFWPTFGPDLANSVVLPLKQPAKVHELRSTETVSLVLREPSRYPLLPSPYFGIVPATALERIRKRSGTVFHSITPDIYAGFAIASVCDRYLYTDRSYSVAGQSRHSNGASQLSGQGESKADSPARKFYEENTITFHRDLIYAPSIPVLVAEAALQARDAVALDCDVDVFATIRAAIRDPLYLSNPSVRPTVDRALSQVAAAHHLDADLAREMRRGRALRIPRLLGIAMRSILLQHPMLECDPLTVSDVSRAAAFIAAQRPKFAVRFIGPFRRLATRPRKTVRVLRAAARRVR